MNIIRIEGKEIGYPVGLHLDDAMNYVNNVAVYLNDNVDIEKKIHIYCIGSSGSILAALLSTKLTNTNVCVCHIKKEGEIAHTGSIIYYEQADIHIIIDDFSYSGKSIQKIYNAINYYNEYNSLDKPVFNYVILSNISNMYEEKGSINIIYNIIKPLNLITTDSAIKEYNNWYDKYIKPKTKLVLVTPELEPEISL